MKFITEKTKKMRIFLFLLCLTASIGTINAQGTYSPSRNVELTTQAEVDAFGIALGTNTRIQASILIEEASNTGDSITDLSVFKNLTHIYGNLTIWNTKELTVLSHEVTGESGTYAFGALEEVEATFSIGKIDRSTSFTSLGKFPSLRRVRDLTITNCDDLRSIDAETFPVLERITGGLPSSNFGDLRISSNGDLRTISGFIALTSVVDEMRIVSNGDLRTISGFTALTTVGDNLTISTNRRLSTLSGFTSLTSIGENIVIHNNSMLGDCCGIPSRVITAVSEVAGRTITLGGNAAGCNITGTNAEKAVAFTAACGIAGEPPTLTLSGTEITDPAGSETNHTADAVSARSTLTVSVAIGGSATGWSAAETADTDNIISLSDPASGVNGETLTITIARNTTSAPRTATITFTSTGRDEEAATQILTITQAGFVPTLSIRNDVTTYNIASSNVSLSINIESNTTWRATLMAAVSVVPRGSFSGDNIDVSSLGTELVINKSRTGTLSFAFEANTASAPRTVMLRLVALDGSTVLSDPAPIDVSIIQAGTASTPPTLDISGTGINGPTGSSTDFTANADATGKTLTVAVAIGNATGWSAVETTDTNNAISFPNSTTGGNGGTLAITIASNATTSTRTATVTFTSTGGTGTAATQTLVITQAAAQTSPTLTISGSRINDPTNSEPNYTYNTSTIGSTLNVSVAIGNATGWTATETTDANDLITLPNSASGVDGGTLVVTITRATTTRRTATITFTSTGGTGTAATQTLVITQAGVVRTLSVPGGMTTYNIPSSIFRLEAINIESNTTWRAAITEPETVVVSMVSSRNGRLITNSGSGVVVDDLRAATLLINFAANTETTPRDIILTLSGRDGSNLVTTNPVPITITITQAAAAAQTSPKIMLTSHTEGDSISISHDNIDPITIDFTLEGSATGWTDTIIYIPDTTNFITMDTLKDDTISITITPSVNTSAEPRTATITLITTGHEGTPDSVSLTIIQGARADTTTLYSYTRVDFSLYPNPTKGKLTVEGVTGHLQIYIHDLVGREVMTYSLTPSNKTIDVSNLPSGMYIVTVQGEDKTWTEVLIIVN